MRKILELKQAVAQLEVDVAVLSTAEKALSDWQRHGLERRDGSDSQDALHEEQGQNVRARLWQAKRQVESQKKLVASLASAV